MACNWPSLDAFLSCSTQWRTGVMTAGASGTVTSQMIFIGLDYAACDVVLRARSAAPGVLEDIMAMEEAALAILNEAP